MVHNLHTRQSAIHHPGSSQTRHEATEQASIPGAARDHHRASQHLGQDQIQSQTAKRTPTHHGKGWIAIASAIALVVIAPASIGTALASQHDASVTESLEASSSPFASAERAVTDVTAVDTASSVSANSSTATTGPVATDPTRASTSSADGGLKGQAPTSVPEASLAGQVVGTDPQESSGQPDPAQPDPAVPDQPAPTAPAPVDQPAQASAVVFSTYVANVGGQIQIDACTGGLTDVTAVDQVIGKPYYAMHYQCGGAPILSLNIGDRLSVNGTAYVVVDTRVVNDGDSTDAIVGVQGSAYLQTCYEDGTQTMRVVGISPQ